MKGNILLLPLGLALLFACISAQFSQNGEILSDAKKVKELCKRYKFLWSDAEPEIFYYCFTNKAAVQLKCKTGFYMCKREAQPFHPCDCKHEDDAAPEDGSMKSKGCPDPFLKYSNYHRHGGQEKTNLKTLLECQKDCFKSPVCIGVDWVEKDASCFILDKAAEQYGLAEKEGIDHYMRTTCTGSFGITPGTDEPEQTGEDIRYLPHTYSPIAPTTQPNFDTDEIENRFDRDELDEFMNSLGGKDRPEGKQITTTSSATTAGRVITTTQATTTTTTTSPVTSATPSFSFTIPDGGCPDPFIKLTNTNHPGGRNVTNSTHYNTPDGCKFYCLLNTWCQAVDFNIAQSTCYALFEIKNELAQAAQGVDEYRKLQCGRPLACYEISGSSSDTTLTSITNSSTPLVRCRGACFVSQASAAASGTITRGCMSAAQAETMRGPCEVSLGSSTVINCKCPTSLCNGLSINALAAQLVHLPLDGHYRDVTDFGRHASVKPGFEAPKFTYLSSYLNSSAVFTGTECLAITSLAGSPLSAPGGPKGISPKMTLAIAIKPFSTNTGLERGVFGNSDSPDQPPSVSIIQRGDFESMYKIGISTERRPEETADYPDVMLQPNQWNLVILSYDGTVNLALQLPKLLLSVSGVTQVGNSKADNGSLSIGTDPVSIGCVPGMSSSNFIGMVDEVRLFTTNLEGSDLQALQLITEANVEKQGL